MSEGSGEVLQWVRTQLGMEGCDPGAWEPSREGFRVDLIHAGVLGLTGRLPVRSQVNFLESTVHELIDLLTVNP